MKSLSLKLDDEVFKETEKIIAKLDCARNRYINEALEIYNKYNKKKDVEGRVAKRVNVDLSREYEGFRRV